jgi:uncharacterized protein (UPF0332 family)
VNSQDLADRAREELEAAGLLAGAGFAAQAVSRAYYAAFYAAEAVLLALDETRSKHSGVITAFVRLAVREGDMPADAGRLLRSLFDRRGQADYSTVPVPVSEAEAAIADAGQVVDAVTEWLRNRMGSC